MSSSMKPRFSGSHVKNEDTTALISDDKNEKDAKIRRKEQSQFRFLIGLIIVLSIILLNLSIRRGSAFTSAANTSIRRSVKGEAGGSSTSGDEKGHDDEGQNLLVDKKLVRKVRSLDAKVREHKKKPNMIMERDPEGLKLTKELQQWTYKLLSHRYGPYSFRIVLDLEFPESIPDFSGSTGPAGQVTFQMAPPSLIPCSVFNFLEIARTWNSGAFHRNAGHVLQVAVHSEVKKSMPFQEYSPEHPHAKGTTGYAGRPSGPAFYISIMDNSKNHGPGSQQHHNPHEADANFGHVVEGFEDVVPRIHSVPQTGWLDKANQIKITKMTILYNKEDGTGKWHEWGGEDKVAKYEIAQSK